MCKRHRVDLTVAVGRIGSAHRDHKEDCQNDAQHGSPDVSLTESCKRSWRPQVPHVHICAFPIPLDVAEGTRLDAARTRPQTDDAMSQPMRRECVINVINPNMTETMTELIARAAQDSASPSTRIVGRTARFGAASIEGHYDEALAAIGLLKEVAAGGGAGADAHVIACFGDPGQKTAHKKTAAPV